MKITTFISHSLSVLALLTLFACSNPLNNIPYRIDIDQGNQISQAQLNQLNLGMNKEEVEFIMGTPLLNDIFNEDRWDYVQYHKTGKTKEVQESVLTLYFKNNLLVQVDRDKFINPTTETPTDSEGK